MIESAIHTDTARWYVLSCTAGYERRVQRDLEQRVDRMGMAHAIHEVLVPTETEIQIRGGTRTPVERKLWPGYVLVLMTELREGDETSNRAWFVVRNTPGVTGIVGCGNQPTPLEDAEVSAILRRAEVDAPRVQPAFARGENVRIIDGPFAELIGIVDAVGAERLTVLLDFFGRATPVELDFLQVEKLEVES